MAASALAALNSANAAISATSSPRRGHRAPKNAINGAPMTTPRAYAEMMWPAVGMDTPTPSAISGSRPIVTNSVVPIANPPMASASIARVKCLALAGRVWGAVSVAVMVTPCSNRRPRTTYSSTPTSDVFFATSGDFRKIRTAMSRTRGRLRPRVNATTMGRTRTEENHHGQVPAAQALPRRPGCGQRRTHGPVDAGGDLGPRAVHAATSRPGSRGPASSSTVRRSPPRGRSSGTTARAARRSPTARSPRPRTSSPAGW